MHENDLSPLVGGGRGAGAVALKSFFNVSYSCSLQNLRTASQTSQELGTLNKRATRKCGLVRSLARPC